MLLSDIVLALMQLLEFRLSLTQSCKTGL